MLGKLRGKKKKEDKKQKSPAYQRGRQIHQIYKMLIPRPKQLLMTPHALIKYGTVSAQVLGKPPKKLRFLFLLNDVLLVTKRESRAQFRLRFYITLRKGYQLTEIPAEGKKSPEFHLICPSKTLTFVAKNKKQQEQWVEAIQGCIDGKFDLYSQEPPNTPPQVEKTNETSVIVEKEVVVEHQQTTVFNFSGFDIADYMDDEEDDFFGDFDNLTLGGTVKGEEDFEEDFEESDEESDEESGEEAADILDSLPQSGGDNVAVFLSASEDSAEEMPQILANEANIAVDDE